MTFQYEPEQSRTEDGGSAVVCPSMVPASHHQKHAALFTLTESAMTSPSMKHSRKEDAKFTDSIRQSRDFKAAKITKEYRVRRTIHSALAKKIKYTPLVQYLLNGRE